MPVRKMKIGNKTTGWQQYMRCQLSNMAVSDAVAFVLQQQPERVLEIGEVVDAIFESQMPPGIRSLARHQITAFSRKGQGKTNGIACNQVAIVCPVSSCLRLG